ncbi:MAG: yhdJ [Amycolatopsis sp.]|uniref:DNA-methyltransferase n=1 Tax=Amycolatopsis sp. TaxID=37632 RepID=UPI002635550C|nr:site-specific DNA-methyltransferase [Amycolatopsis sp.]MCU1685426.1 yhdJ [Amycolatopsis sp.]
MNPNTPLPRNQILVGDVRQRLKELPDASVDCIVTSPPYFAMRDYGHADQIGAEAHVDDWAADIAAVCAELWRVLTPGGSLFLNLGDGYSRHPREGAVKKSLLLGPQRVALRMTEAGWLLRNQVVWAKKNPMPSSVGDRFTTTHEFVYFFTKQANYHFDLDAIREIPKNGRPTKGRSRVGHYLPRQAVPALGGGTSPRIDLNHGLATLKSEGRDSHPLGKNPGDVWSLATGSYRGAHFATFPVELVRRPILATCPQRLCTTCGQPWQRAPQMLGDRRLATGALRPVCAHSEWRRGIVLDPFLGSGTVAVAAEEHERDWIGIELNPEYAALAEKRLADWRIGHKNTKKTKGGI